ncbi:MAG: DUF2892 domain-containing protein [Elusimicrobia bacterium]|nr:DUF2892 domain-containing protein [Candidatus Liberimonas magnetica]
MVKNIGTLDSILRIVIALTLGLLYLKGFISGIFGVILLIIAFILFMTSFVGLCPIYSILKISTAKKEETNK